MLLRAKIESLEDKYHYRVRIPILNKTDKAAGSTSFEDLYIATVCVLPGFLPAYSVGDIVFVGFERDDYRSPVILGLLYRENESLSITDIYCDSLTCGVDLHIQGDLELSNLSKDKINNCIDYELAR